MVEAVKRRASLAEIDGLPIKDAARMPHAVDLEFWRAHDLVLIDVGMGVFRLTAEGRVRARQCCATCVSWRPTHYIWGECYSAERRDDGKSAGVTAEYETCEGHHPKRDRTND